MRYFNDDEVIQIRSLYKSGITQTKIANMFGTKQGTISDIVLEKSHNLSPIDYGPDLDGEIWKIICSGYYAVSSFGRVRRVKRTQGGCYGLLSPAKDSHGYLQVCLSFQKKHLSVLVHKLVMEAFIGIKPVGYEINHKDCNPLNNSLSNLEYVTPRQNVDHAKANDRYNWTTRWARKLTPEKVIEIRKLYANGVESRKVLCEKFGIGHTTLDNIINGKKWVRVIESYEKSCEFNREATPCKTPRS